MIRFCARRLVLGIITLWLVSLLVFIATQALSGDAATAILGKTATPERLAALRSQLHLDAPLWRQYAGWLGGLVRGDLGLSLATGHPVAGLIGERLGNSAFLVLIAAVIAVPVSLAIGVISAVRRDRPIDHLLSTLSLVLAALPEFVIGIALILVLSIGLFHLLPAVSLLAAAAVPASAQGWGFGFSTGNGYDRYSGYYSDYGRGYGDRYRSGYYNRPYYGGYGYGGGNYRGQSDYGYGGGYGSSYGYGRQGYDDYSRRDYYGHGGYRGW